MSDPYVPPAAPELTLNADEEEPHESAQKVIEKLEYLGYLWEPTEFEDYHWQAGSKSYHPLLDPKSMGPLRLCNFTPAPP